ncbi:hypothetical protein N9B14_06115 [Akkermansiaceae bacterium]|nr:hypothetical protein [Akkermansiaceae bacterium]
MNVTKISPPLKLAPFPANKAIPTKAAQNSNHSVPKTNSPFTLPVPGMTQR